MTGHHPESETLVDVEVPRGVRAASDTRAYVDAELSGLLPDAVVDAVVHGLGELLVRSCQVSAPARLTVSRTETRVVVDLRCCPVTPVGTALRDTEADELSDAVLRGCALRWGADAEEERLRLWCEVSLL